MEAEIGLVRWLRLTGIDAARAEGIVEKPAAIAALIDDLVADQVVVVPDGFDQPQGRLGIGGGRQARQTARHQIPERRQIALHRQKRHDAQRRIARRHRQAAERRAAGDEGVRAGVHRIDVRQPVGILVARAAVADGVDHRDVAQRRVGEEFTVGEVEGRARRDVGIVAEGRTDHRGLVHLVPEGCLVGGEGNAARVRRAARPGIEDEGRGRACRRGHAHVERAFVAGVLRGAAGRHVDIGALRRDAGLRSVLVRPRREERGVAAQVRAQVGFDQPDRRGLHRLPQIGRRGRVEGKIVKSGNLVGKELVPAWAGIAGTERPLGQFGGRPGAGIGQDRQEHGRVEHQALDAERGQRVGQAEIALPEGDRSIRQVDDAGEQVRAEQRREIALVDLHPDRARLGRRDVLRGGAFGKQRETHIGQLGARLLVGRRIGAVGRPQRVVGVQRFQLRLSRAPVGL